MVREAPTTSVAANFDVGTWSQIDSSASWLNSPQHPSSSSPKCPTTPAISQFFSQNVIVKKS